MLTKEDKTLIKNVWESKKYGVKRLIKEFPNKKWSKRGVEDFQKRLRTTGPLNEHPVVDVRARTEPGESTPDTPLHSTELMRARNTSNK